MVVSVMSELNEWESFYVIVGSAAGALIGLQFVVMTLIAERPKPAAEAGAAFGTPTIVHFSIALLLSAVLRAPWQAITPPAGAWGLIGLIGGTANRVRPTTKVVSWTGNPADDQSTAWNRAMSAAMLASSDDAVRHFRRRDVRPVRRGRHHRQARPPGVITVRRS